MTQQNPKDWKTYDEFAYGIDTNRLPATDALHGRSFALSFDDGRRNFPCRPAAPTGPTIPAAATTDRR